MVELLEGDDRGVGSAAYWATVDGAFPGDWSRSSDWCTLSSPAQTLLSITNRDTITDMAHAISVRLDDEALLALRQLEACGVSRSEAIRKALVDAASRLRDRRALAAEVAALEADEADRAEMLAIAELMENLRASG